MNSTFLVPCSSISIMLSWLENHMFPCALKSLAGFDCPLCGGQRAFIQLLKGNFADSFSIYPPLLFILIYFAILTLYLSKSKLVTKKRLNISSIAVLSVIFINYTVKIITGEIAS
jgi:hypothetical protein